MGTGSVQFLYGGECQPGAVFFAEASYLRAPAFGALAVEELFPLFYVGEGPCFLFQFVAQLSGMPAAVSEEEAHRVRDKIEQNRSLDPSAQRSAPSAEPCGKAGSREHTDQP